MYQYISNDNKGITKIIGHAHVLLINHGSNYSPSTAWPCLDHFLCQ